MVAIVDVKNWQKDKFQNENTYIKPTIPNNRYYKCITKGITGNLEPVWNSELFTEITDNQVTWLTVPVISIDFDIITFLPEEIQNLELYQEFKKLFTFIKYQRNLEIKSVYNKYKNITDLEDVYLKELIKESGYDYIYNAKAVNSTQLQDIYSFLKVINLLKGTRKGLILVLDLLKYPYTEQPWYEQTPIGKPNTAKVTLDMTLQNFSSSTLFNLYKFFRSYVMPIIDFTANIFPFQINESFTYATMILNQSYTNSYSLDFGNLPTPVQEDPENITHNSADLILQEYYGNVGEYLIDVSTDNFLTYVPGFHNYSTLSLTVPITGLNYETEHKARFKVRIGNEYTGYSNIKTFTTDSPPIVIVNSATNIFEFGFRANWQPFAGAVNYLLYIYDEFDVVLPAWNGISTVNNYYDVMDLGFTDATLLKYKVKAFDGVVYTDLSDPMPVTTADYLSIFDFSETSGINIVDKSVTPLSSAILSTSSGDSTFIQLFDFNEGTGTILNDKSVSNNDGNILENSPPASYSEYVNIFDFNEGTGTILNDLSPNNNDGVIS